MKYSITEFKITIIIHSLIKLCEIQFRIIKKNHNDQMSWFLLIFVPTMPATKKKKHKITNNINNL